jgi:Esterase/lipase
MKRLFVALLLFACSFSVFAQDLKEGKTDILPDMSIPFAEYDTLTLALDFYMPKDVAGRRPCVIFAYGGGFMENNQRSSFTSEFCRKLADEQGYVAVATDYRLGLKGQKMHGIFSMVKPVENSIHIAAEDLMKATRCLIDNAEAFNIDTEKIIIIGSSAGACTVLQADYELCNRTEIASILPKDFHYAGVISFSGAAFSRNGKLTYKDHDPAPTFMLHGKSDKLVNYNKIAFLNLRFSGSNDLVKQFKKNDWPHKILRFEDEGHGVATYMIKNFDDVIWFIDNMVFGKKRYQIDETFFDPDREISSWDRTTANELYK